MRRKIKNQFSRNKIGNLLLILKIITKIKDWYSFFMYYVILLNYIGLDYNQQIFKLRNGLKIKTKEIIDTATISVIFLKKDYGTLNDNQKIIIDIGGNIGAFALYAAISSKNSVIYSYEPTPDSYNLMVENIKINKFEKRIFPFNFAVGSRSEEKKLYLSSIGSAKNSLLCEENHQKSIDITCITMNDIFSSNKINECDLLKYDCEGSEYDILLNTPLDILNGIKEIRMEYHKNTIPEYNINNLISYLSRKGFKVSKHKESTPDTGMIFFIH